MPHLQRTDAPQHEASAARAEQSEAAAAQTEKRVLSLHYAIIRTNEHSSEEPCSMEECSIYFMTIGLDQPISLSPITLVKTIPINNSLRKERGSL